MLEIQKEKTEFGYKLTVFTDEGEFYIIFAGNLDLYFGTTRKQMDFSNQTFLITKENYRLYNLFETLFYKVKNYEIFDFDLVNQELKEKDLHNKHKLFSNNKIDWHSDDGEYEKVSRMIIEHQDENYKITFCCSNDKTKFSNFWVSICNNGSRYHYFNKLFMDLYHELINYDLDDNQIYIEEYIYNEKIKSLGGKYGK